MSIFNDLLDQIPVPRVVRITQEFERRKIPDPAAEASARLRQSGALALVNAGASIAITVGSRGISNQPAIVRSLVEELLRVGAHPFIVPAMGSHGGATAEGQRSMLAGLGIDETSVGAPVRATMETVDLGPAIDGVSAYIDRFAYEADGIIVLNRIKPHVAFRGAYESGLAKMIAIGLGKQRGAEACHDLGFGRMAEHIPAIARRTIESCTILFAIGILENAYHETARIEIVPTDEILAREPALQAEAKRLAPHLPFSHLDVLIMDEIGKEISGTGFDTNLVGRFHTPYASGGPEITRVGVLDLTEKSHGNANGLGIVDFTTRRVFEKFRFDQTYPNSLTSTVPVSVKIPMVLDSDRQVVQAAIKTCNIQDKQRVRLARIRNTLAIETMEISENLAEEAAATPGVAVVSGAYSLPFDDAGNLL